MTSVANVNPALTSHVNNIKICFLKIERMLIYTPYVADASEIYSVRSLQKSVLRIMDSYILLLCHMCDPESIFILVQLGPDTKSTCAVPHINWYQNISQIACWYL